MKPTDILQSEHRVIEQVLECLQCMTIEAEQQRRLDAEPAREAIAFLRTFADGCHHAKEEDHLFPAMEARGFPRNGGPTGVMLHEHELGRQHIRGMDDAVEGAAGGDRQALSTFVDHARAYIELLRQHIQKEDHCLFAMADQVLSDQDNAEILSRFDHLEEADMGSGTHAKFLQIADRLAERYGVAKLRPSDKLHASCGCSHH